MASLFAVPAPVADRWSALGGMSAINAFNGGQVNGTNVNVQAGAQGGNGTVGGSATSTRAAYVASGAGSRLNLTNATLYAEGLGGSGTKDSGRLLKLQVVRKSGILSERELDITESYTATQLRDQIARGQLKSVEVTVALAKRAALAQQFVSRVYSYYYTMR